MGKKGEKRTTLAAEKVKELASRLAPVGEITTKGMFGGYGIFFEGVMFSVVDSKGTAFLRVSDATVGPYEAAGAAKHGRMPYFAVPDAVLGADDALVAWAREAAGVAIASKK